MKCKQTLIVILTFMSAILAGIVMLFLLCSSYVGTMQIISDSFNIVSGSRDEFYTGLLVLTILVSVFYFIWKLCWYMITELAAYGLKKIRKTKKITCIK